MNTKAAMARKRRRRGGKWWGIPLAVLCCGGVIFHFGLEDDYSSSSLLSSSISPQQDQQQQQNQHQLSSSWPRHEWPNNNNNSTTQITPHLYQHSKTIQQQQQAPNTFQCTIRGAAAHSWSMARFVVFQRNGEEQLQRLLAHYLHAAPSAGSMVVIDHHPPNVQNAKHNQATITHQLLTELQSLGGHVWDCHGAFDHKGAMWSAVARVYGNASEFIFPIDVDELMVINPHYWARSKQKTDSLLPPLVWDAKSLHQSLTRMMEKQDPYRPFKVEGSAGPIPIDCVVSSTTTATNKQTTPLLLRPSFASPLCQITTIRRRAANKQCVIDKSFCRGNQLVGIDKGNHHLKTKRLVKMLGPDKLPGPNQFDQYYQRSDIVMIHLQRLSFGDWLVHAMRGPATRGYNQPKRKFCPKDREPYCRYWILLTKKARLDPDKLREAYRNETCSDAIPQEELFDVPNLFAYGCGG